MNIERVKSWLKHLGIVLALVGVVLLLTLLFNFLGTLSCAAVVGMMLGGYRRSEALVVAVHPRSSAGAGPKLSNNA